MQELAGRAIHPRPLNQGARALVGLQASGQELTFDSACVSVVRSPLHLRRPPVVQSGSELKHPPSPLFHLRRLLHRSQGPATPPQQQPADRCRHSTPMIGGRRLLLLLRWERWAAPLERGPRAGPSAAARARGCRRLRRRASRGPPWGADSVGLEKAPVCRASQDTKAGPGGCDA